MCGIVGIISNGEGKEEVIKQMTDVIRHRGPDDDGFFMNESVGLGMRRLSIIDLGGGKQPIYSIDKTKVIVFNGEIYNYLELRNELIANHNDIFQTESDTEVVLKMYEHYGTSAFVRLRGMFALAIHDTVNGTTVIARDHFGIKPLYYVKVDEKIISFGSEIKSLLLTPNFQKEFNKDILASYLHFQYNPHDETFFKNVFKLAPGNLMTINRDCSFKIEQYFTPKFSDKRISDLDMAKAEILNVMKDCVAHHMIADVEVGSFLSGGVDSSIIVSLMQSTRKDKIKTFTVGFKELSEGEGAKETSNKWQTDHHELNINWQDYKNALDKVAYHFDEPVADPSAVALYFLAEEASKHVKVVLSGEGADEFFGGYNVYREPFTKWPMKLIPGFIKRTLITKLVNSQINFFGKNYLKRGLYGAKGWYIGNAQVWSKEEVGLVLKNKESKIFNLDSLYNEVEKLPDSEKMQYIDWNTWLIGDILQKADKMSMAHSLEVRVPFLDTKVFDLARTLSPKLKWGRGETKFALRHAFKNIIPGTALRRKKLGFPIPLNKWLKNDPTFLIDLLNSQFVNDNFDQHMVGKLVDDHLSGKCDNARKLYTLVILQAWYNRYY